MGERKDGGPAFGHGNHEHGGDPGMSLRDYFAGKQAAAIRSRNQHISAQGLAMAAYADADAMLAQREKDRKR